MKTLDEEPFANELESQEELSERHRREKRELQSKIQGLKKSTLNDKKKRKEIQKQIAEMEKELCEKHSTEMRKMLENLQIGENGEITENGNTNGTGTGNGNQENERQVADAAASSNKNLTKTQRRRNRREQQKTDKERRFMSRDSNSKSLKDIEMTLIKQKLRKYSLKIYQIQADGNCLYNAVSHQLKTSSKIAKVVTAQELRNQTSDFIRKNKTEFMPFMYDIDSNDVVIDDRYFEQYCDDIVDKVIWGGQLELNAISSILARPIRIVQSENEILIGAANNSKSELIITYHKHLYTLGEHYNSTVFDDGQTSSQELSDDF